MEYTTEDIADKANSMGVVAKINNDNHVTLYGDREVQVWTTGTIYADYVPKKFRRFKSRKFHPTSYAVEQAVRLAKGGYIA
jgi:hypothetical protein